MLLEARRSEPFVTTRITRDEAARVVENVLRCHPEPRRRRGIPCRPARLSQVAGDSSPSSRLGMTLPRDTQGLRAKRAVESFITPPHSGPSPPPPAAFRRW